MTTTQTVEEILRPLVEATVACPECQGTGVKELVGYASTTNMLVGFRGNNITFVGCPTSVPDPRFEALRKIRAVRVRINEPAEISYGGIDASLGAIARAAAACGFRIARWLPPEIGGSPADGMHQWQVHLARAKWEDGRIAFGATLEEAAARALVTAWGSYETVP